jgi:hypothetical protein
MGYIKFEYFVFGLVELIPNIIVDIKIPHVFRARARFVIGLLDL